MVSYLDLRSNINVWDLPECFLHWNINLTLKIQEAVMSLCIMVFLMNSSISAQFPICISQKDWVKTSPYNPHLGSCVINSTNRKFYQTFKRRVFLTNFSMWFSDNPYHSHDWMHSKVLFSIGLKRLKKLLKPKNFRRDFFDKNCKNWKLLLWFTQRSRYVFDLETMGSQSFIDELPLSQGLSISLAFLYLAMYHHVLPWKVLCEGALALEGVFSVIFPHKILFPAKIRMNINNHNNNQSNAPKIYSQKRPSHKRPD